MSLCSPEPPSAQVLLPQSPEDWVEGKHFNSLFFFFLLEHTLKLVSLLRNNVSVGNLEMVAKEIAQ